VKVLALVCASVLAACGNSDTKKPDALVKLIDAPMADAPRDAPIDAAAVVHFGRVEIAQGTGNGSADSGLTAAFSTDEWGPASTTDGPCHLISITGTEPTFSAGTISLTGTISALSATASGTAPAVHYAATGTVPKPAFTAGATINFSGAGGPDVGAFSGSVVAPAAIAGYTPPPTSLSRSGYTATWTAGVGPTMWLVFGAFDNTGHGLSAVCVVDDNGSFAVPSTTMAMIPSTATMAYVGLGRVVPMTTTVAGVAITVQATSYVTSGVLTVTQ
jgi:hypothetical protein